MKKMILLLQLLLSANAFAAGAPEWWNTSECRHERNLTYLKMLSNGWSSKDATQRVDEDFKRCICSSSDETKQGVNALLESGFEIEMILPNPTRVISRPITYRDFTIYSVKNECYLNVQKSELCENSAFLSAASQSFRVFQTYDAKNKTCKLDLENEFFK